jgi:hypothetical protein
MKASQDVFNGTTAQKATDQLQLALISPLMPTYQAYQSDAIWARFHRVFIEYEANRLALAFKESALPHISRNNSIRFNANGHTVFVMYYYLSSQDLSPLFKAFSAGLTAHFVQFGGTIQPDSTVIGKLSSLLDEFFQCQ